MFPSNEQYEARLDATASKRASTTWCMDPLTDSATANAIEYLVFRIMTSMGRLYRTGKLPTVSVTLTEEQNDGWVQGSTPDKLGYFARQAHFSEVVRGLVTQCLRADWQAAVTYEGTTLRICCIPPRP